MPGLQVRVSFFSTFCPDVVGEVSTVASPAVGDSVKSLTSSKFPGGSILYGFRIIPGGPTLNPFSQTFQ